MVSVLPVVPPERYRAEEPEGSGIVWTDDGHVVTALHVIDGAERILVRSHDGDVINARLVAGDQLTDLAVLEIDADWTPAELGGDPPLGASVCAVGNAFGLGLSVACGVVSGVHQAGVGFNPVEDFVQTDAAVNPGASGGALLDDEGRVVGVLSAIFTREADANIGVNFAVATPLAARVVEALVSEGRFHPPQPGLRLSADPPPGESGRRAARVDAVMPDSPAATAGLEAGDRILRVDAWRVQRPAELTAALARLMGPASVTLEVERDGSVVSLDMAFPADAPADIAQ